MSAATSALGNSVAAGYSAAALSLDETATCFKSTLHSSEDLPMASLSWLRFRHAAGKVQGLSRRRVASIHLSVTRKMHYESHARQDPRVLQLPVTRRSESVMPRSQAVTPVHTLPVLRISLGHQDSVFSFDSSRPVFFPFYSQI